MIDDVMDPLRHMIDDCDSVQAVEVCIYLVRSGAISDPGRTLASGILLYRSKDVANHQPMGTLISIFGRLFF